MASDYDEFHNKPVYRAEIIENNYWLRLELNWSGEHFEYMYIVAERARRLSPPDRHYDELKQCTSQKERRTVRRIEDKAEGLEETD